MDKQDPQPKLSDEEAVQLLQELPKLRSDISRWCRRLKLDKIQTTLVAVGVNSVLDNTLQSLLDSLKDRDQTINQMALTVVADLEQRIKDLTQDEVTHLPRFQFFQKGLVSYLESVKEEAWCLVGFIDIADFKKFNDAFVNHDIGDRVLFRIARFLEEHTRASDLISKENRAQCRDEQGRRGGDEMVFCILDIPTRDIAVQVARDISERFHRALHYYDWTSEIPNAGSYKVKVDMGIVCHLVRPIQPGMAEKLAKDLIQAADHCMYEAKERTKAMAPELRDIKSTSIQIVQKFEGECVVLEDLDFGTVIRRPIV